MYDCENKISSRNYVAVLWLSFPIVGMFRPDESSVYSRREKKNVINEGAQITCFSVRLCTITG